jgi:hypothetical protein
MFELQSKPLTGTLAEIWPDKIIREMSYKELRKVMADAPEDWRAEAIAAASLDIQLDDLLNLPGRYSGAMAGLLSTVMAMHGLVEVPSELQSTVNGTEVHQEDAAPKH